ncbi:RNA polymerase sigma factor [Planctomycetota bacterium]
MADQDLSLVHKAATGDPNALGALYDRYGEEVYRVARRVLLDHGAAEDVTQDVFLRAWRAAPSFRGGSVKGWLMRITLNLTRDCLRRKRRNRALARVTTQVEARAEKSGEDGEEVERALAGLPPHERASVVLKCAEGLTFAQIAAITGVSLRTAKYRVAQGLDRLRRALDNA